MHFPASGWPNATSADASNGSGLPASSTAADVCAEKVCLCAWVRSMSSCVSESPTFSLHQIVRLMGEKSGDGVRVSPKRSFRLGKFAQRVHGESVGAQFCRAAEFGQVDHGRDTDHNAAQRTEKSRG